jgi:chromosome partitioning protein
MPVLAFANLKGGVAKTSNAVAVAETLARRGYKVLVIDADHQCTSSEVLLGEPLMLLADKLGHTLHDLLRSMIYRDFEPESVRSFVLKAECAAAEVRPRLFVMPCSVRIDEFHSNTTAARKALPEGEFAGVWKKRRIQLRRWLRDSFDFTIIDCPPSLSKHVQFLLRISDGIIVPSIPDRLSVRGAEHFERRVTDKKIAAPVLGTLWTLYRAQVERHHSMVSMAKQPNRIEVTRPFETVIPNAAALAAASDSERVFGTLKQKYTAEFAGRYEELCDEILSRLTSEEPGPTKRQLRDLVPVRLKTRAR